MTSTAATVQPEEEPMQGRKMVSATPELAAPKPVQTSERTTKRSAKKQSMEVTPMPDSSADSSNKPEQAGAGAEEETAPAPALPAAKRQKRKAGADAMAAAEAGPPVTATTTSTKAAPAKSSSSSSAELSFKQWVEGAIETWSKAEGQSVSAAGKDEFVANMYRELNKGGERAKKNNRKIVQPFDFGY